MHTLEIKVNNSIKINDNLIIRKKTTAVSNYL